jgi:hypothetical protein
VCNLFGRSFTSRLLVIVIVLISIRRFRLLLHILQ